MTGTAAAVTAATDQIAEVFADAGTEGFLFARQVGVEDGPTVSHGGDESVVLASVFKIPVVTAYAREVVAGRLDPTEVATVTKRYRIGGIGTAGAADDVQMSWRDLARFMMIMSDNAATDVIFHRVGQQAVDTLLADLHLGRTRIMGCCEDLFASVVEDIGGGEDIDAALEAATPEQVWNMRMRDPERTTASTPREITTLLNAIWTDVAASPEGCEIVRNIMAQQIWPHRLTSGFPNGVTLAAKTGTVPGIRNEAGVVTYPDGRQYAVAVFTRANDLAERRPEVDASIGKSARIAIEYLRSLEN